MKRKRAAKQPCLLVTVEHAPAPDAAERLTRAYSRILSRAGARAEGEAQVKPPENSDSEERR